MIGLVIVTHGGLALEFRSALEHVVGPQTQLETVSIGPDDDMSVRRGQILDAVRRTNNGEGVIILTDMFGGTPSNLAISVMDEAPVEVIAGINLPILVKLASVRGLGILAVPSLASANLTLVADLTAPEDIVRFPDPKPQTELLGLSFPLLLLAPFEASAPLKLLLALAQRLQGSAQT